MKKHLIKKRFEIFKYSWKHEYRLLEGMYTFFCCSHVQGCILLEVKNFWVGQLCRSISLIKSLIQTTKSEAILNINTERIKSQKIETNNYSTPEKCDGLRFIVSDTLYLYRATCSNESWASFLKTEHFDKDQSQITERMNTILGVPTILSTVNQVFF